LFRGTFASGIRKAMNPDHCVLACLSSGVKYSVEILWTLKANVIINVRE